MFCLKTNVCILDHQGETIFSLSMCNTGFLWNCHDFKISLQSEVSDHFYGPYKALDFFDGLRITFVISVAEFIIDLSKNIACHSYGGSAVII